MLAILNCTEQFVVPVYIVNSKTLFEYLLHKRCV